MRKYFDYIIAFTTLGIFSGVLVSMGSHMLFAIGFFSFFWAGMLAPMLIDNK